MAYNEHLSLSCKITQAITLAAGASASTDVEGTVVDMSGYSGIMAVVMFGPIAATSAVHINMVQSTVVGMTNPDDLAGTKQVVAADKDNTIFYIDVIRPEKQFVQLHVDRGTDVATCSAFYILYGASNKPVAQSAATITGETFVDVIAGSA